MSKPDSRCKVCNRHVYTDPPPFFGGQGRSGAAVVGAAFVVLACFVIAAAIVLWSVLR